MTPKHLAEQIGIKRLATLLGVTDAAVRNAATRGALPPAWFFIVEQEAHRAGVECPRHCFGFKLLPERESL